MAQVTDKARRATGLDRWWWVAAIAILAVTGAAVALSQHGKGDSMDGPTAARSRDQLNEVLLDTAARIGIDVTAADEPAGPLTCILPGGGTGESYFLQKVQGPVIEDVDGALATVRAMWEDLGYTVSDRAILSARGLSADTTDGGSVYILTGPGGTFLDGEAACTPATAEADLT